MTLLSALVSIAFAVGPSLSFLFQWQNARQGKSLACFSLKVTLILLVSSVLRIFFWVSERFAVTLLASALITICVQLGLLHAVVTARAAAKKDREPRTHPIKDFWEWDSFRIYMGFLSLFVALVGGLAFGVVGLHSRHSGRFFELLGCCSAFVEALLAVPQMLKGFSSRSMQGVSVPMVCAWLGGDVAKGAYLVSSGAPPQFIFGNLFQMLTDSVVTAQLFFLYPTSEAKQILRTYLPFLGPRGEKSSSKID